MPNYPDDVCSEAPGPYYPPTPYSNTLTGSIGSTSLADSVYEETPVQTQLTQLRTRIESIQRDLDFWIGTDTAFRKAFKSHTHADGRVLVQYE